MPDRVSEIMDSKPVTVAPDASVEDVVAALREHELPGLPVVDADGQLVGIVTERDVLRAVAEGRVDGSVGEVMTASPDTIETDETAAQAATLMIHGGFRHLPVVDDDRLAGFVSMRDIFTVLIEVAAHEEDVVVVPSGTRVVLRH